MAEQLGNLGCIRKSIGLDYLLINGGALYHTEIWHKQKADQVFDVSDLFKISVFLIQILSLSLTKHVPDKWNFAFSHYHFSKIKELLLMPVVKPTIYGIQKYIVSHVKLRLSSYNGFMLNDHHPQSSVCFTDLSCKL